MNSLREDLSARLSEYAAIKNRSIAFDDMVGCKVTYGDLESFRIKLSDILPCGSVVAIHLARGSHKAALIGACIANGTPGFCIEARMPSPQVHRIVSKFRPAYLCTTRATWQSLEAHLPPAQLLTFDLWGWRYWSQNLRTMFAQIP